MACNVVWDVFIPPLRVESALCSRSNACRFGQIAFQRGEIRQSLKINGIIQMKISQTLKLCLILALATAVLGETTPLSSSGTLGEVLQLPPFELMDLTALLASLNLTYDQVAQNLTTTNPTTPTTSIPTPTPASDSAGNTPTPNTKQNPSTNNADVQQKQTSQSSDSKSTKTGLDASKNSSPAGIKSSDDSKNTTPPPKITDNAKATGVTTQTPVPPVKTTSTQTTEQPNKSTTTTTTAPKTITTQSTQTQTTTTSNSKNSQTPPTPTSTASSNTIPTFGPGPQNKNLPPVIDITKLVVDTPLPTPPTTTTTSSNLQQSTPTPSKPVISTPQSTPTQTQTQSPPSTQTKTTSTQTTPKSQPVEKKPETTKSLTSDDSYKSSSKPSTPVTQQPSNPATQQTSTPVFQQPSIPVTPQPITPPISQRNVNEVYLAPIVTPQTTTNVEIPQPKPAIPVNIPSNIRQNDRDSTPIQLPEKKQTISSSPASYQCWSSSPDAIYNITASYKAFSKYFIISGKDAYLPNIQAYLLSNYGNYLSDAQMIAGFRLYNSYGDNSLDYQLLLSTNYGTFVAILTYWPDSGNIQLKSLSILNFFIMEIDYSNCQEQDNTKQNCKVCNEGFRNFFGRCQAYDPVCIGYISDECGKCGKGERLSNGICL